MTEEQYQDLEREIQKLATMAGLQDSSNKMQNSINSGMLRSMDSLDSRIAELEALLSPVSVNEIMGRR